MGAGGGDLEGVAQVRGTVRPLGEAARGLGLPPDRWRGGAGGGGAAGGGVPGRRGVGEAPGQAGGRCSESLRVSQLSIYLSTLL